MFARDGSIANYKRFPAIDGKLAAATHSTKLNPGNLGCWLSHLAILKSHADGATHVHTLEDDAVFAPGIAQMIDRAIEVIDAAPEGWDIMFTECALSIETETYLRFHNCFKQFKEKGYLGLIPLNGIKFGGTSSLVFNRSSIGKILGRLNDGWSQNLPIDLFIRREVDQNQLKAYVWAPFLTSVSPASDVSDISGAASDQTHRVMDIFRRAFYCQANHDELLAQMKHEARDAATAGLSALYIEAMRFVLSDKFKQY